MADTLESLEIEIKHSASGAADQIKAVASAIRSVGRALEKTLPQLKVFSTMMSGGSFGVTNNVTSQTADTINNVNQVAGRAGRATKEAAKGVRELSKEAAKSKTPLNTLIDSLKRIAFYRIIRGIIKAIGKAFNEGLQYAYAFSDGISTSGHRFAEAMDTLKSSSTQMKAQLGSAFISLLAAITPIITAIISLVTKLAVALSQLFAAFTGGTYLKAAEVSDKFADDMKRGAGGAKEWRNQLLGFDEINRLNEPSGGGGGGSSGLDPADMFEDTKIDGIFAKIAAKWQEFKDSLNFEPLKESFDNLGEAAQRLGDTILKALGWVWDNILAPLGKWFIEEAAPATVNLLAEAFNFLNAALEAVSPVFQWLWDNILKPIAEWTGELFVNALQTIADLLHDLTDLLSGNTTFKDFIKDLSPLEEILLAIAVAIAAVYVALGVYNAIMLICSAVTGAFSSVLSFLAANPVVLVIAAIAALILIGIELYKNWDEVSAFLKKTWEGISEFFTKHFSIMLEGFTTTWNGIKEVFMGVINFIVGLFTGDWQRAWDGVAGIFQGFSDIINGIIEVIVGVIAGLISWCQGACEWIQSVLTGMGLIGGTSSPESWNANLPEEFRAGGGFVDEGQLFVAREAGPELVGTMNGRTAVANNDQIVDGIRQGVFEAVSAAMSNGNNGNGTEFKLFLDSREIKFGLERLDRAWGA